MSKTEIFSVGRCQIFGKMSDVGSLRSVGSFQLAVSSGRFAELMICSKLKTANCYLGLTSHHIREPGHRHKQLLRTAAATCLRQDEGSCEPMVEKLGPPKIPSFTVCPRPIVTTHRQTQINKVSFFICFNVYRPSL